MSSMKFDQHPSTNAPCFERSSKEQKCFDQTISKQNTKLLLPHPLEENAKAGDVNWNRQIAHSPGQSHPKQHQIDGPNMTKFTILCSPWCVCVCVCAYVHTHVCIQYMYMYIKGKYNKKCKEIRWGGMCGKKQEPKRKWKREGSNYAFHSSLGSTLWCS